MGLVGLQRRRRQHQSPPQPPLPTTRTPAHIGAVAVLSGLLFGPVVGPFDELAVLELGAGTHQGAREVTRQPVAVTDIRSEFMLSDCGSQGPREEAVFVRLGLRRATQVVQPASHVVMGKRVQRQRTDVARLDVIGDVRPVLALVVSLAPVR